MAGCRRAAGRTDCGPAHWNVSASRPRTAYPEGVTQYSSDAPARAHAFTLSSADDGLAALGAWRDYPRVQQPVWPDEEERAQVFED
ncbi:MAG: hypothetical protein ACTH0C_08905, partial [Actinomycetaceae bacterium]